MIKDNYTQRQIPEKIDEPAIRLKPFANEGKVLPVCYRCAQVPRYGLYDGFRVQGMFFCSDCLQELFSAEQDSPEYLEYLFLVKEILF